MPANDSLLLIERFNVAPSADGEWTKYAADGYASSMNEQGPLESTLRVIPHP